MPRIEPLPINEWPREMRAALAAMTPPNPRHPILSAANRPKGLNTLGAYAHHVELAHAFFTFNGHLLMATTLTARQREMIVMRVAVLRQCEYEWTQHVFSCREAEMPEDEIARITYGPDAPFWSPIDAALLRAVDELLGGGAITRPTWDVLLTEFDTKQMLDIIFTVGAYETLAYMVNSLELEMDDDLYVLSGKEPPVRG